MILHTNSTNNHLASTCFTTNPLSQFRDYSPGWQTISCVEQLISSDDRRWEPRTECSIIWHPENQCEERWLFYAKKSVHSGSSQNVRGNFPTLIRANERRGGLAKPRAGILAYKGKEGADYSVCNYWCWRQHGYNMRICPLCACAEQRKWRKYFAVRIFRL